MTVVKTEKVAAEITSIGKLITTRSFIKSVLLIVNNLQDIILPRML